MTVDTLLALHEEHLRAIRTAGRVTACMAADWGRMSLKQRGVALAREKDANAAVDAARQAHRQAKESASADVLAAYRAQWAAKVAADEEG